jgi:hypothetical protein
MSKDELPTYEFEDYRLATEKQILSHGEDRYIATVLEKGYGSFRVFVHRKKERRRSRGRRELAILV